MKTAVATLVFVTLVWGSTFPLLKALHADTQLNGLEISALRIIIASLCLSPLVFTIQGAIWRAGIPLAASAFAGYVTQAWGLMYISSNRSAFITALSVILVPLLGWVISRRFIPRAFLAAGIAMLGLGLMSWEGGGDWRGDGSTLACAVANAYYILTLSRISNQHPPLKLAAVQVITMALLGLLVMSATGSLSTRVWARAEGGWPSLIFLGAIATAGVLGVMAMAQRRVPAEKAALIYTLEPVFAGVCAYFWLHETLGTRSLLGACIILAAVIWIEWPQAASQKPAAEAPPPDPDPL